MQQETSPVSQIPVIRFTYNVNVSDKSGLIFETYAAQDEPVEKINALVDKLVAVADRQAGKCELAQCYVDLEALDGLVGRIKDDLDRVGLEAETNFLKSGKRGEFKLNTNEAANKRNLEATLAANVKRRDQVKAKIAELTEKGR